MNELFWSIIILSISGSVLILEICLLKPLIRNRLTKTFQYYLWLIIVIRLLVPISPDFNVIGNVIKNITPRIESLSNITNNTSNKLTDIKNISTEKSVVSAQASDYSGKEQEADSDILSEQNNIKNTINPADEHSVNYITELFKYLWIAWIVGVLLSFLSLLYQYIIFTKGLEKRRTAVNVASIQAIFLDCCNKLKIKKQPKLYTDKLINTPMLTGFFRPKIILPEQEYSSKEIKFILLHELNHLKKKDILLKWLVQITVCIHWFNPFVHYMVEQIRHAGELACDEAVIKNLNDEDKQEYGLTLINLSSGIIPIKATLAMSESKKNLKDRLTSILKYNKSVKKIGLLSCVIIIVLLITAVFTTIRNPENSKISAAVRPSTNKAEQVNQQVKDSQYYSNDNNLSKDTNSSGNASTPNIQGNKSYTQGDVGKDLENTDPITENVTSLYRNLKNRKAYTYEQLEEIIYKKAKLVEQDFNDIQDLELSLPNENVIINRGGNKLHMKYYQWYDDQYERSLINGKLEFKHKDDSIYLELSTGGYTDVWLPQVLKRLKLDINPEDPKDSNGTIFITIPNNMTLKNINSKLVSGTLLIDKISANSIKASNVSGSIEIKNGNVGDLSIENVSGMIHVNTVSGDNLSINNTSSTTTIDNCSQDRSVVANISGENVVDGGKGKIKITSISGHTKLLNIRERKSISIENISGMDEIKVSDLEAFNIGYETILGSLKVGSKTYSKNVNLNKNAANKIDINNIQGTVSVNER